MKEDVKGTTRQRVLLACLRGAAKGIPLVGGVFEELLRVADELQVETAKAIGSAPDGLDHLEEAAEAAFGDMEPSVRKELETLAGEVTASSGKARSSHAKRLVSELAEHFVTSESFHHSARPKTKRTTGRVRLMAPEPPSTAPSAPPPTLAAPPAGAPFPRPAGAEGSVRLHVRTGQLAGESYEFQGPARILVGRQRHREGCDLVLPGDTAISSTHFVLELCPPGCLLRDLSRNGTVVDGRHVRQGEEANLEDGSVLKLGKSVKLEVSLELRSPNPPAAAPDAPRCSDCGQPLRDTGTRTCAKCAGSGIYVAQPFPGLELIQKIGEGNMGEVFLARDLDGGGLIAVKTLKPHLRADPARVSSFLREAKAGAVVRHPNAVRVFDAREVDGLLYFLMEYVRGIDAFKWIKRGGPFTPDGAVEVIHQINGALAQAHDDGIVHRDVKPHNILLTRDPRGVAQAKVADFGLAKKFEAAGFTFISKTGSALGTLAFMPPEQVEDAKYVRLAADVYALGATLHYLMTGRTARDFGTGKEPILIALEDEPAPLREHQPDASKELEEMLLRCQARDPADRFASVRELDRELVCARGW